MSDDNKWNTEPLTRLQVKQMERLIEFNPEIDSLIAETIVRMPKDKLAEIVKKHKAGELKNEPEPERDYIIKDAIKVE
jgi:hypothetical protein